MKGLVMMALLALSFNASAEWVYIQNSEVGRFYYEPSSIKKHGRSIDVLTLFDMNGPHEVLGKNVQSQTGADVYDCKAKKNRTVKIVDYAEKQGKGEAILNFDIKKTEWHKISKDSNAGALHEILCKQPVLNKS